MLEKPDVPDEQLANCLQMAYNLAPTHLTFLPLGADSHTAVYRATAGDNSSYFVKLRRGFFDETAVALPKALSEQGNPHIIPPIPTAAGRLWATLYDFTVILAPFVEGHNGYTMALSAHHWHQFGAALKHIHTTPLPAALITRIPCESFSPQARDSVKTFLSRAAYDTFDEPVAQKVAALLQAQQDVIRDLLSRADSLARALQAQPLALTVCHSDIHAGNILIDTHKHLFIVDWDNPIRAPKERDLMFIGGGQGFLGYTRQEEETLFYQAYGATEINPMALAYYRYERIIQDIAVYCEQLLLTEEGGADREQSLHYLASNFHPDSTIAVAYASDKNRWEASGDLGPQ